MIVTFEALVKDMREDLTKAYRETLPFASVVALTRTAISARDGVRDQIRDAFDRPTPYAQKSPQAVPANKTTMTAAVILRNSGKLVPGQYLAAEIDTGERRAKASEKALRLAGVMPSGDFEIPGKDAPLDIYGNLSQSTIQTVLAVVKATKLKAPAVRRRRKAPVFKTRQTGTPYFVARSKATGQPTGIWQVVSIGHVAPVLIFTDKDPDYHTRRLPFDKIVERVARVRFPIELDKALLEFTRP